MSVTVSLKDIIPDTDADTLSIDELFEKYVPEERSIYVFFEDPTPKELDVLFPTTDDKLGYVSSQQKLRCLATYEKRTCKHAELLVEKQRLLSKIVSHFIDLNQILDESYSLT